MAAAVALLGQELDVTVVINSDSILSQRLNGLIDDGVLEGKRIIGLGPISEMAVADFEDLFYPEDYVVIYNAAFESDLSVSQLPDDGDCVTDRIRQVEGDFNRDVPANWFLGHRKTASFVLRPTTLDRFERLFEEINRTLA